MVRRLVEHRLAACGTVFPTGISVYRWDGKIEETAEAQVLLKTRRDRWPDLETAVREHHPYKVPELLALPVAAGLAGYLDWLGDEVAEETA